MDFPYPVTRAHLTITRPTTPTYPKAKAANAVAEIGFTRLGAQEAYFHVLAGVDNRLGNDRWESQLGRFACCADHKTFAREFTEVPLQKLPRWHLCGIRSGPMHYEANALYWAAIAAGRKVDTSISHPDPVEAFKATVAWGAVAGEVEGEVGPGFPPGYPWTWDEETLHGWLIQRLPALMVQFKADVEAAFPGMWAAGLALPEGR